MCSGIWEWCETAHHLLPGATPRSCSRAAGTCLSLVQPATRDSGSNGSGDRMVEPKPHGWAGGPL